MEKKTMVQQEKMKYKRTHFFINRKLQGNYMLLYFIPMLIILVFMIFTLYFAAQTIINTAAYIVKEDIKNIVSSQLQDKIEPSTNLYKNTIDDITVYLNDFSENKKYRSAVLVSLLWVFGIGIFIIIIQLVLLTIFFSHKLAGPIYRFETVCHNIINGNYKDRIILRKGDDMQNLAGLMNEVIVKTRERFIKLKETKSEEEKLKIIETIEL